MNWILITLAAYFFLAIANLLDKFVVDKVLPSGRAYALVACLMSGLVFFIAPWFLEWPGWFGFGIDLIAGAIFALALWMLYESLRRGEASRIIVFIGGLTPVFTLIFSSLFLKERFTLFQWLGFLALLAGIFLVAFLPKDRQVLSRLMAKLRHEQMIGAGAFVFALFSALAYASYFTLTKFAYAGQPFLSAFIWTRLGAIILVLLFLVNRSDRKALSNSFSGRQPKTSPLLILANQGLGALGFLLQNFAVFLGSAALVSALQGAQYAWLLIMSTILALSYPKLLRETFSWRIFLLKLLAVLIIGVGLYFIIL